MLGSHVTRTRLGIVLAVLAGVALGAVFGQPGSGSAAVAAVPKNKTLPTISGTAEAGQTLTASHGTWANSPTSFSYSWTRCDTSGNGCATIAGATAKIYTATSTDVGHTLRVAVAAHNSSGTGRATSAPTSIVSPSGCPPGTGCSRSRARPSCGPSRARRTRSSSTSRSQRVAVGPCRERTSTPPRSPTTSSQGQRCIQTQTARSRSGRPGKADSRPAGTSGYWRCSSAPGTKASR
jgi:hypothetical protein